MRIRQVLSLFRLPFAKPLWYCVHTGGKSVSVLVSDSYVGVNLIGIKLKRKIESGDVADGKLKPCLVLLLRMLVIAKAGTNSLRSSSLQHLC